MEELQQELEDNLEESRLEFLDKSETLFRFLEYKYKNNLDNLRLEFMLVVFKTLSINFLTFVYSQEISFDDISTISDQLQKKFNSFMDHFCCRENRERIMGLMTHTIDSFVSRRKN